MKPRHYRRVEDIDNIRITDHVTVTDDKVTVTKSENKASTMLVRWFNADTDEELPESSAIYNKLETEFQKLSED